MIHTIFIDENSEINGLKKEFRKKLMTGGAVIRLKPGLSEEQKNLVRNNFMPHAEPNNIAEMVLKELDSVD